MIDWIKKENVTYLFNWILHISNRNELTATHIYNMSNIKSNVKNKRSC